MKHKTAHAQEIMKSRKIISQNHNLNVHTHRNMLDERKTPHLVSTTWPLRDDAISVCLCITPKSRVAETRGSNTDTHAPAKCCIPPVRAVQCKPVLGFNIVHFISYSIQYIIGETGQCCTLTVSSLKPERTHKSNT